MHTAAVVWGQGTCMHEITAFIYQLRSRPCSPRKVLRTALHAAPALLLIEGWYNPHRRHSALNYLSLLECEKRPAQTREAAA